MVHVGLKACRFRQGLDVCYSGNISDRGRDMLVVIWQEGVNEKPVIT